MVAIMLVLPRVGQFDAHTFYEFCEDRYNRLADRAINIGFHIARIKTTPCGPSGAPLTVEKIVAGVLERRLRKLA